jgi:hypothetical protein
MAFYSNKLKTSHQIRRISVLSSSRRLVRKSFVSPPGIRLLPYFAQIMRVFFRNLCDDVTSLITALLRKNDFLSGFIL